MKHKIALKPLLTKNEGLVLHASPQIRFSRNIHLGFRNELRKQDKAAKTVLPGVSVVCCSNRPGNMDMVFNNYLRQTHLPREMIIILNNNSMNLQLWQEKASRYPEISVFQLDEAQTLGECLNFAIERSRFDYIAKFDDDDYYGKPYLASSILALCLRNAGIAGKCSIYVYLVNKGDLLLLSPGNENCFVDSVRGATLLFKKDIWQRLRFQEQNVGEDTSFLTDSKTNGIAIFSADRFNYVNIRQNASEHTWQLDEDEYLRAFNSFQFITRTENYLPFISK
jgi:glycosyltransferase involved in cell wall biosynthesis